MSKNIFLAFILINLMSSSNSAALARWGTFTMTDDNGEQVVVKHGLFSKKMVVQDRFGDGFANKRTIFGLTKDTQVGVLGNDVHVHKGLFGFGKTNAQTMLGDTVTSSKNPLYRNTNVNLRGVSGLLNSYFQPKQAKMPASSPIDNGSGGNSLDRIPATSPQLSSPPAPFSTGNSSP